MNSENETRRQLADDTISDGDETLMLESDTAESDSRATVKGVGAPVGPDVKVNRSPAELASFETMDDGDLRDPDTPTLGTGTDGGTALDAKIRRHLDEGHRTSDPLLGTVIGERYEVHSRIGAGGMGAVYRARQRGMGRDVAIKVLLQDLAQNETITRRFTIEALAVSRLKHPNTIQIFDFGRTDRGNLYIAMELLEGQTLSGLLGDGRKVAIRRALRIIAAAAGSLTEAHAKDIIHRDLKPENIFLTQVGEDPDFVKVLDFGVAKLRDGAGDGKGTLTKAGSIFGTPRYMSPEQAGGRATDGRADLYSLGVILYELICGRPPFEDERPLQLLLAHTSKAPEPPSAVCPELAIPRQVETLVMRLLEKAPERRVQSASDLAAICLELVRELPDDFDAPVLLDGSSNLRVELSTPATLDLASPVANAESTLDLAMGEGPGLAPMLADPPVAPRPWTWPLFAVGGTGVGLLAVVLALRAGVPATSPSHGSEAGASGHATPDAASFEGTVALAAASTSVVISLTSRPAGAEVHLLGGGLPGRLLGVTPLELERPTGKRLSVRIRAAHHVAVDRELSFVRHTALDVTLRPLTTAAAPQQPDAGGHGARPGGRSERRARGPQGAPASRPTPKAVKPPPLKPKAEQLVDELL